MKKSATKTNLNYRLIDETWIQNTNINFVNKLFEWWCHSLFILCVLLSIIVVVVSSQKSIIFMRRVKTTLNLKFKSDFFESSVKLFFSLSHMSLMAFQSDISFLQPFLSKNFSYCWCCRSMLASCVFFCGEESCSVAFLSSSLHSLLCIWQWNKCLHDH